MSLSEQNRALVERVRQPGEYAVLPARIDRLLDAARAEGAPAAEGARQLRHVDDLNDPVLAALANPPPGACPYCLTKGGLHAPGCDMDPAATVVASLVAQAVNTALAGTRHRGRVTAESDGVTYYAERIMAALSPPAAEGKEDALVRRLDEMAEFYRYRPHSDADVPGLEEITKRERDELFALLDEAARRIAALSQTPTPAAEPVAWRMKDENDKWLATTDKELADRWSWPPSPAEPLYASPPPEPVAISREEIAAAVQAEGMTISAQALLELGYHHQDHPDGISPAAHHIANAILSKLSGYPLVEGQAK